MGVAGSRCSLLFRSSKQSVDDKRSYGLEGDLALAKALERYLQYREALSQASAPDVLPRTKQDRPPAQVNFADCSVVWFLCHRPAGSLCGALNSLVKKRNWNPVSLQNGNVCVTFMTAP